MATCTAILMRQASVFSARAFRVVRGVGQKSTLHPPPPLSLSPPPPPPPQRRQRFISTFSLNNKADCFNPTINGTAASHRLQQVRWKGRNDGARYANRVRKPTKKQRRKHNLKLKRIRQEQNKHSPPGSKAALRREEEQMDKDELLKDSDDGPLIADEYTADDALLDDMIGNTSAAHPTPEPVYLGHQHRFYFDKIADQMEDYRNYQKQVVEGSETTELALPPIDLPSDRDISMALRAFRDKHGTKQKPVGIVAALQHIIQDMGVPLNALDQLSYSTLLTCCRTEPEARRVFQLMRDQQVPISAYCWSILVDIHAKLGDYEGCVRVHEEMKQTAGLAPTLASFTSLLAACYKICNDGRVAHSIRARAAKVGWENWMEMRITGIDADVMAYGAMLRLMAAQGQPEKAINLLEEMPRFEVKPTTLCFTSALRAVARSHETANRYEHGSSRRYRRREEITQHHGKLARSILIQAEEHGVEFDSGLIAALTLCAAAAGDLATAKAIYVASQIRRMDQFRTIGSESHLARLRGEDVPIESNTMDLLPSGSNTSDSDDEQIAATGGHLSGQQEQSQNGVVLTLDDDYLQEKNLMRQREERRKQYPSFGEREYGKDSRVLSAILLACARTSDKNGIGTMWQGRENKGYLCINSLRLIAARWKPQYYDNEIPGQKFKDNLTWEGEHRNEDYRPGKRQSRKFKGVDVDESGGTTLDDLDEEFYRMFVNEDGRTKEEFRKKTPEDIWRLKYGDNDPYIVDGHEPHPLNLHVAQKGLTAGAIPKKQQLKLNGTTETGDVSDSEEGSQRYGFVDAEGRPLEDDPADDVYFDFETKTWKKKIAVSATRDGDGSSEMFWDTTLDDAKDNPKNEQRQIKATYDDKTEFFFDDNEMRWKTRPKPVNSLIGSALSSSSTEDSDKLFTEFESDALTNPKPAVELTKKTDLVQNNNSLSDNDFELFFDELREEAAEMGEENVSEEEARELWAMMNDEFDDSMLMNEGDSVPDSVDEEMDRRLRKFDPSSHTGGEQLEVLDGNKLESRTSGLTRIETNNRTLADEQKQGFGKIVEGLQRDCNLGETDDDNDSEIVGLQKQHDTLKNQAERLAVQHTAQQNSASFKSATQTSVVTYDSEYDAESSKDDFAQEEGSVIESSSEKPYAASPLISESVEIVSQDKEEDDPKFHELRELLPALSDQRLKRILKVFKQNLGNPPLLELVPIVRENMPDYITNTWLKKMSALTANYVVQKAAEDHLVDRHILNGVLEIETSHGSLDRALDFHQTEFSRHQLQPTNYSDRLVLQMFLKNKRLSRALSFKQKVEASGRTLDLKAYGSLIDYCSRRKQIGSAMLLLKECTRIHGAPPGEAMLKQFRSVCRKNGLNEKFAVKELIGDDPFEWIREGKKLRRNRSKESNRKARESRSIVVRL